MTSKEETDLAEKLIRAVAQCTEELDLPKDRLTIDIFLNWAVDKAIKSKKRKKHEK
jgi:hypothetical protein